MNNKKKTILIFLIFLILLLAQIHFVWIYYDDYGYISLSYLPNFTGNMGMNTSFSDIISFLVYHYNHWGGRVLWFLLEIVLLRVNMSVFKIVQSIFTLSIFYLIYKIIVKTTKIKDWKLALGTLICFLLVDFMVIRDGYYWFTASVLYLLPMLPLLLVVYFTIDKKRSLPINILCVFLAFIASWSQEQISVLMVAYLGLLTLHRFIIEKDRNKWNIIITISALIGFAIIMLAPGSKERMTLDAYFYSLDIFHKAYKNLPLIIGGAFSGDTRLFTVLFFTTSTYYIIKKKDLIKNKLIINTAIINSLLMTLITILVKDGYFMHLYNLNKFYPLILAITTAQLIYIFIIMGILLYKEKKYILVYLLIGGVLSQVAMIMAPYYVKRCVNMFEISYYIIVIYILSNIIKEKKINTTLLLIPILIIGGYNYFTITKGYYNNYSIKVNNELKLQDASKRIKNGEEIKEIILENYDAFYGTYESDSVYYLMRYYYDIPEEVIIKYDRETE